jgi:hypothetical protein
MSRLLRDVIADPPALFLPGIAVEMIGVEELPTSWSPQITMNGPSIVEPPEPMPLLNETLLQKANAQDKTQLMIGAGGAIFSLPIANAKAKAKAKAIEVPLAILLDQQTIDNDGLAEMTPSVPQPDFGGRYVPGAAIETAFPAQIAPNPVIMRGNLFRNTGFAEMTIWRSRVDLEPMLATPSFYFVGVTRTGVGAALADCRLVVLDTGRLNTGFYTFGQSVVAQGVSDGSGNFSIQARNADHIILAFKDGSPELAGLTRDDAVPGSGLSIYLRDPTVADAASSAAYRPVGSPVVRRIDL